jgi:large subunit ribosomal protein L22
MSAVETPVKTVAATAKFVHVSPRKARLVVDHIRGRSVPEARTILAFTARAAASDVEKVLRSAVANAESNPALHWNGDDLVVAAAFVDEGPTLKRWRARARGRVARIRKRTCHITIKVAQAPEAVAAAPVAEPKKRTPRKKKES